jgi:hypothetical protein
MSQHQTLVVEVARISHHQLSNVSNKNIGTQMRKGEKHIESDSGKQK